MNTTPTSESPDKAIPLLSIIVPVYGVEDYLRGCIESVLSQTFRNIELILVDDGSPDSSPGICDEYAGSDARVVTIHQANQGASAARNTGMRAATGRYLMFLDADDYWEGGGSLAGLVSELEVRPGVDILVHGCTDFWESTGRRKKSHIGYNHDLIRSSDRATVLGYLFSSGLFPGSAWITVVNRRFILDNELYFVEGMKGEDIDWLLSVFTSADSFTSTDDSFYVYRKGRRGSITSSSDIQSIYDVLSTVRKWDALLCAHEPKDYVTSLRAFLSHQFLTTLITYAKLPPSDRPPAKVAIAETAYISRHTLGLKHWAAAKVYRLLGLEFSSRLLSAYHNRHQGGV